MSATLPISTLIVIHPARRDGGEVGRHPNVPIRRRRALTNDPRARKS